MDNDAQSEPASFKMIIEQDHSTTTSGYLVEHLMVYFLLGADIFKLITTKESLTDIFWSSFASSFCLKKV